MACDINAIQVKILVQDKYKVEDRRSQSNIVNIYFEVKGTSPKCKEVGEKVKAIFGIPGGQRTINSSARDDSLI